MKLTAPTWLVQRGGGLKIGSDGDTRFVLLGEQPLYSLSAVPATGKYTCVVRQIHNGRRIDGGVIYSTEEEALGGGLEELRKDLGWS